MSVEPTSWAGATTDFQPEVTCPACGDRSEDEEIEKYAQYALLECRGCGLQFWEPRRMPDGRWYEQVYADRDAAVMPLEPGHRFFLSDARAPGRGKLLDIGCGTGNFLAAARQAGYEVTGIELDANAARVAREHFGLQRVRAHLRTIEDATFRLTADGIVPNRFHWLGPAKRRGRAAGKAVRRFMRTRLWHPLLDATRTVRHSVGLREDAVVPGFLRRKTRRHEMD